MKKTSTTHDVRKQLFNEQKTGTFAEVQLPRERVTSLHGLLLDLDPKLYRPGNSVFEPDDDPRRFHQRIRPVLDRHPLARFAEVRATGTGLHVLVWLEPPVELTTAAAQARWDVLVRTVQCTLPVDLNAPGITALTRAVGSINAKNGAVVEVIHAGQGVAARAVEEFIARLSKAPFKEVVTVLFGEQRITPCPVCHREGSRLDVLDHVGKCYVCGKVSLSQVFDCIYAPLPRAAEQTTSARKGKEPMSGQATCTRATRAKKPGKTRTARTRHTKQSTARKGNKD